MTLPTEPMSNVDAAWLSMDHPTNLMMITGVMTFRRPLNLDHFMAVVKHRWLRFDRFRQRIVKSRLPMGMPYWEEDPHFDLNAHVRRIALPAPGDKATLQEMASTLMSTPLDYSKPLWQVHIIERYGEGSAIITRLHHSIADGMALIYVLLSLTDMTPDAPWPQPVETESITPTEGTSFGGALGSVFKQGWSAARTVQRLSRRVARESWTAVNDPDRALELLLSGADTSYAASRLLLRPSDPPTPFKGTLGVGKRAAWSRPLPLRDVKAIKGATRTTVNDVLVSAMSGAVRRYMLSRGVDPVDFRAVVPVNMRKPEEMEQMGNKFGLVFLSLPVSIADPLDRLAEVNRRMRDLKDSPEAMVALGILNAMGLSPSEIQGLILKTFATKATTVLTNVPGPPVPLFLAGSEIENIMFWVPQSGRLGLGISILSYAGKVFLGVAADGGLVPDPDAIVAGFYDEFDLLMEALSLKKETTPAPAPPAPAAQPMPPRIDDLTKINGIGPKAALLLRDKGIASFKQLSQTKVEDLQAILAAGGSRYRTLDPATWPEQARYLAHLQL